MPFSLLLQLPLTGDCFFRANSDFRTAERLQRTYSVVRNVKNNTGPLENHATSTGRLSITLQCRRGHVHRRLARGHLFCVHLGVSWPLNAVMRLIALKIRELAEVF